MSSIHYKFKNAKNYSSIRFEGPYIALSNLKKEIIKSTFGPSAEVDLLITNANTKQEYSGESTLVPKNASVIVKRLVSGPVTKSKLAAAQVEKKPITINTGVTDNVGNVVSSEGRTEEERFAMLQKQQQLQWGTQQGGRGRGRGMPISPNYICFRCGESGHRIVDCPTNGDPAYDTVKVRRTTGIPKSQLVQVKDGSVPGAMINSDGTFSVLKTQLAAIKQNEEAEKMAAVQPIQSIMSQETPTELLCPLCHKLFRDAVDTPCCSKTFCDECIRNELLSSEDFKCPACSTENVSPNQLEVNHKIRAKVADFKARGNVASLSNVPTLAQTKTTPPLDKANESTAKQDPNNDNDSDRGSDSNDSRSSTSSRTRRSSKDSEKDNNTPDQGSNELALQNRGQPMGQRIPPGPQYNMMMGHSGMGMGPGRMRMRPPGMHPGMMHPGMIMSMPPDQRMMMMHQQQMMMGNMYGRFRGGRVGRGRSGHPAQQWNQQYQQTQQTQRRSSSRSRSTSRSRSSSRSPSRSRSRSRSVSLSHSSHSSPGSRSRSRSMSPKKDEIGNLAPEQELFDGVTMDTTEDGASKESEDLSSKTESEGRSKEKQRSNGNPEQKKRPSESYSDRRSHGSDRGRERSERFPPRRSPRTSPVRERRNPDRDWSRSRNHDRDYDRGDSRGKLSERSYDQRNDSDRRRRTPQDEVHDRHRDRDRDRNHGHDRARQDYGRKRDRDIDQRYNRQRDGYRDGDHERHRDRDKDRDRDREVSRRSEKTYGSSTRDRTENKADIDSRGQRQKEDKVSSDRYPQEHKGKRRRVEEKLQLSMSDVAVAERASRAREQELLKKEKRALQKQDKDAADDSSAGVRIRLGSAKSSPTKSKEGPLVIDTRSQSESTQETKRRSLSDRLGTSNKSNTHKNAVEVVDTRERKDPDVNDERSSGHGSRHRNRRKRSKKSKKHRHKERK